MRPKSVGGADRDHPIGVAGVDNAESGVAIITTLFRLEALIAKASGGRDDDDAISHQPLAFVANGRAPAGIIASIVRNGEA